MSDTLVWIWAAANLLTGLAYVLIPYEIWHWYKETKDEALGFVALIFALFIVSCGLHHLVMPFTHGHVAWVNLATDIPMALISVFAHLTLYRHRTQITRWFQR